MAYCCRKRQLLQGFVFFILFALWMHLITPVEYIPAPELSGINVQVRVHTRKSENRGSKWVILHSYMRGGSTFLGSLFDQNEEAFYWFEAILSAYHSMLGIYWLHPLQMYSDPDHAVRNITGFEKDYLQAILTDLQDCNLEELPVQFIMSKYLFAAKTHDPYLQCVQQKNIYRMEQCAAILEPYCGQTNPVSSFRRYCHAVVSESQDNIHTYIESENVTSQAGGEVLNLPEVTEYRKCIQPLQEAHNTCLPLLLNQCKRSRLHVFKVIRSNPSLTMDLHNTHNDSYVLYQVRDPRGILMSRMNHYGMSYPLEIEAKRLCDKMLQDYRSFQTLQGHNRVLVLRYEDIVTNAKKYLEDIYDFIDEPVPDYLRQNVIESVHATVFFEFSHFHTRRRNGAKTANAWRKSITTTQKCVIDNVCKAFLEEAGYDI